MIQLLFIDNILFVSFIQLLFIDNIVFVSFFQLLFIDNILFLSFFQLSFRWKVFGFNVLIFNSADIGDCILLHFPIKIEHKLIIIELT